jgi:hypothetical protein
MKNKDLHILGFYSAKPKNPRGPREAGYMKNPDNITWTEAINITRGLKDRDLTKAQVILNLNTKTVIRNVWNDNKDFPSLLAYYQENYPKYINPIIAVLYKDELNETTGNVRVEEEKESSGSHSTTQTDTVGS